MVKLTKTNCENCGVIFQKKSRQQKYCGSKVEKTGCSWENILKKKKEYSITPKMVAWRRKYFKDWNQKTKDNSRRKEQKSRAYKKWYEKNKEIIREKSREWRKENIKRIIHNNKLRSERLKKTEKITFEEFEQIKKDAKHHCLICDQKKPLTMDHIIPLSKGGTTVKSNIQPLCQSCNSRKHNNVEKSSGQKFMVAGSWDFFHEGHKEIFEWIFDLADGREVYIGINSDNLLSIRNKENHQDQLGKIQTIEDYLSEEGRDNYYIFLIEDFKQGIELFAELAPIYLLHGNDWNKKGLSEIYGCEESWWDDNQIRLIYKDRVKGISSTQLREKLLNEKTKTNSMG